MHLFEKQSSEPFYPDSSFYDAWDDTHEQLNIRLRIILKWLKCGEDNVEVVYDDLAAYGVNKKESHRTQAGFYIITNDDKHIILVSEKYRRNPFLVNAVLAHECIHYFLNKHGLNHPDPEMNEQKTDLCVIASGLGILTLNGMQYLFGGMSLAKKWHVAFLESLRGHEQVDFSLGYFRPRQFCEFFEQYLAIKKIPGSRIIGYIQPMARYYLSPNIRKAKPDKEIRIVTVLRKLHRRNFTIHCIVVGICAIPVSFLILARISPELARDIWKAIFGNIMRYVERGTGPSTGTRQLKTYHRACRK